MHRILLLFLATQLAACASSSVAQNFSMLGFEEKPTRDLRNIGSIEGRDCTWYVMGYGIGEDPNVRNAFANAMNQRESTLIPGQKAVVKGAPLKAVKNVSVENGGFNAYIASRSCVIVTGVGLQ